MGAHLGRRQTAFALLAAALAIASPSRAHAVFDFDQLRALINGQAPHPAPVESAEQLLDQLPDALLSNFTFVHFSRTTHGYAASPRADASVTPLFPRVLLFTPDARLIVALTGDPRKPDYDVVETLNFVDAEARFHLNKFVLPAAIARRPGKLSATLNGQADPFECTRCHGKDPRALFDSYDLWPGFYGSRSDAIGADPFERENYPKFLAAQKNAKSGIYRKLHWPTTTATPPYDEEPTPLERPEQAATRPNTRLGMALTELNRARLGRIIRAAPRYGELRLPLLAGLVGCQKLPIDAAVYKQVAERVETYDRAKLKRAGFASPTDAPATLRMQERTADMNRNLTEIFYVAEVLGLQRTEWSLAFEPGAPAFFDGILSGTNNSRRNFYLKEDFVLEILTEMAARDPAFAPYFETYVAYPGLPFAHRLRLEKLDVDGGICGVIRERWSRTRTTLPKIKKLKF